MGLHSGSQRPGAIAAPALVQPLSEILNGMLDSKERNLVPCKLRRVDLTSLNPSETPVVIVHRVTSDMTPTALFNVFSFFGIVVRVKIMSSVTQGLHA